jgi:hypothetical protein
MRVVVHEYAKGGRVAFETSDDGSEYLGEWDGTRRVGERICAFIEVDCDGNERGVERLLDALAWLTEEIKRRKQAGELQPSGTRAFVHEYAKGGRTAFETSVDGSEYLGEWGGTREVGERICAYIEVGCDGKEHGVERMLDALAWLTEEIKRRKQAPVSV